MSQICSGILELATLGGAKAVGVSKIIGSVTQGKEAGLLSAKSASPRLVTEHYPVGGLE